MDLCRIDFCDPQGGKGPCDRKAAQIKMHVKRYINQGHSVTTPADLRKAIESAEILWVNQQGALEKQLGPSQYTGIPLTEVLLQEQGQQTVAIYPS